MHFYSWKCTFIVSVKWLLEQHAYFSYLKYSYTSTSERKGGFAINQVQKESRLWLSKFLLVFTMIIWCKFSPACHRLDGEVSYLYRNHALSLLCCTVCQTGLFSDSKDFSGAFLFCIFFESDWFPGVFDLRDWHFPALLTIDLRFDWSAILFRLRDFFSVFVTVTCVFFTFWLVYRVLCRQSD